MLGAARMLFDVSNKRCRIVLFGAAPPVIKIVGAGCAPDVAVKSLQRLDINESFLAELISVVEGTHLLRFEHPG